jgi:hypothetical protein
MKFAVLMTMVLALLAVMPLASAEGEVCTVYITGIGCPACAQEDPIILDKLPKEESNFVVIEYEIYRQQENGNVMMSYDNNYNSGFRIPLIIFGKGDYSLGVGSIRQHAKEAIEKGSNHCPLPDGSSVAFNELDLTALPAKPKIWKRERILIKTGEGGNNTLLKKLLTAENLSNTLEGAEFEIVEPQAVVLSGREVHFDNAIKLDGWIFQWNGEGIEGQKDGNIHGNNTEGEISWVPIVLVIVAIIAVITACFLFKGKGVRTK